MARCGWQKGGSASATDNVRLAVDGLEIAGKLYFPEKGQRWPTLCICHGIPAGPPDPTDQGYPLLAERFSARGFVVLIFNFRGCGESEGNLDMLGWARDLDAVLGYLCQLEEVDRSRLSVLAFSGGAAVSVYQAARDDRIRSLVTCACPANFSLLNGQRVEEFLTQCRQVGTIRDPSFPASLGEWAQGFVEVTPANWVHRISPRPLFIIHGDQDEVVHPSHAWELYAKAREPKQISMIGGGGHRLRDCDEAMDTALDWLKKVNGIAE